MAAEGADGVVCVSLSSKMSATIEAARQGARALEGSLPVRVVDSLSVTLGQGLVTIEAAQRARDGGDLDEVAPRAEGAVGRLKVFGAIDTLENLKKGGRIGGAQALLGSLLSIKPVIQVTDGVVEEESKQRTRGRALRYLAGKVRDAGPISRLAALRRRRRRTWTSSSACSRACRRRKDVGGRDRAGDRHPRRPGHHRGGLARQSLSADECVVGVCPAGRRASASMTRPAPSQG